MEAKVVRIGMRVAILAAMCVLGFYIGRPLYWKLTATLQEIREKEYSNEAVKLGFSNLMRDAQNSVWGVGDPEIEAERTGVPNESNESKKDTVDENTRDAKARLSRLTRRLLATSIPSS